ncbi:hypothetical protein JW968_03350 [Candidatus Woesearchaeota archaeon]|nr:hypothetical protein [Candidatus Woesearchaeota archaeon]
MKWIMPMMMLILALTACKPPEIEENGLVQYENYTSTDLFAICLASTGMQLFGSSTCGGCVYQKNLFGEAFKHINYVECNLNEPNHNFEYCREMNITHYPSWVKDEVLYPGSKTFQELSIISGCAYPGGSVRNVG